MSPTGGGTGKTWVHTGQPDRRRARRLHLRVRRRRPDRLVPAPRRHPRVGRDRRTRGPRPAVGVDDLAFGAVSATGSTDSPVAGTVPTALDVATNTIVYLKDGGIYIARHADDLDPTRSATPCTPSPCASTRRSTRSGSPTAPRPSTSPATARAPGPSNSRPPSPRRPTSSARVPNPTTG